MRVVFNIKVYYLAKEHYPEFNGLKGCKYPSTPAPRKIVFTARESVPFDQKQVIFKTPDKFEIEKNIIHYSSAIQITLTPASPNSKKNL